MPHNASQAGTLLKEWRRRRRLSQLDLACDAGISARHLSFLETGRSQPSRDMVLRLADWLNVPLRERNALLLAAGFAPLYSEKPLSDPELAAASDAVQLVLTGHEPLPALAIDRHWNMIAANRAVPSLLDGAAPRLLAPPVNVLRLSLHPEGLAPRIVNLTEWRSHLLHRLRHQVQTTGDAALADLLQELRAYGAGSPESEVDQSARILIPLELNTAFGALKLFSTTTVFGTPRDVTLSEIAIESFFPSGPQSAGILRKLAGTGQAAT